MSDVRPLPAGIHTILLLLSLLLAFFLRTVDVGNWPVRWDEAFSVWESQMDFLVGTAFTAEDVHPPLYFWLLHVWIRLTGISEFAIRMLSVFAGLLSVSLVYVIVKRLCQQRLVALVVLLLIATSPYHIKWSQDARMYAVAMFFASLTMYAYWRRWHKVLIIAGVGMMLTHYFGAIVLGILVLHRVIYRRELRHGRRQFVLAIAAIAGVFMLWGAYAFPMIRRDPSLATFQPAFAFKLMATLFTVGQDIFIDAHAWPVLIITTLFFLGLLLSYRDGGRAATLVLLGCLLPATVVSALALPFMPVHVNALQARHFSVFTPFVFAGFGIVFSTMISRSWLRPGAALAFIGLITLNLSVTLSRADARYFKDDYRSMMQAIAVLTTKDDRVYFTSGGRKPLVYYHLNRAGYNVPRNARAEPLNIFGIPRRAADVDAMMQRVFSGVTRFWLIEIEAHLDAPLDARTDWIERKYHRIMRIPVAWNSISLYSVDEYDSAPNIAALVPPVVTEARPGDQIRIGVPAGMTANLIHSGQVVDSMIADTWMLHQFDVYSFYFNGQYMLQVGDETFPFAITHSREFPGFETPSD